MCNKDSNKDVAALLSGVCYILNESFIYAITPLCSTSFLGMVSKKHLNYNKFNYVTGNKNNKKFTSKTPLFHVNLYGEKKAVSI
jgi:hypothetical protein